MIKIMNISKTNIKIQTAACLISIIAAVALPQLVHQLGAVLGLGTALGEALLPMHLPIMLTGLIAGPIAGGVSGLLSPIISFALSGMPAPAVLPFMACELAVYGLVSGVLRDVKIPAVSKVAAACLCGRIARSGAVLLAVYAFNSETVKLASAWAYIPKGIIGIGVQLVVLPLIIAMVGAKSNEQ